MPGGLGHLGRRVGTRPSTVGEAGRGSSSSSRARRRTEREAQSMLRSSSRMAPRMRVAAYRANGTPRSASKRLGGLDQGGEAGGGEVVAVHVGRDAAHRLADDVADQGHVAHDQLVAGWGSFRWARGGSSDRRHTLFGVNIRFNRTVRTRSQDLRPDRSWSPRVMPGWAMVEAALIRSEWSGQKRRCRESLRFSCGRARWTWRNPTWKGGGPMERLSSSSGASASCWRRCCSGSRSSSWCWPAAAPAG